MNAKVLHCLLFFGFICMSSCTNRKEAGIVVNNRIHILDTLICDDEIKIFFDTISNVKTTDSFFLYVSVDNNVDSIRLLYNDWENKDNDYYSGINMLTDSSDVFKQKVAVIDSSLFAFSLPYNLMGSEIIFVKHSKNYIRLIYPKLITEASFVFIPADSIIVELSERGTDSRMTNFYKYDTYGNVMFLTEDINQLVNSKNLSERNARRLPELLDTVMKQ